MDWKSVCKLIFSLCRDESVTFDEKTSRLYNALDSMSDALVLSHIEDGGLIPEAIPHDSSEEKLYAKYCDYLLARGLTLIGVPSKPITERADVADVEGKVEGQYSIVGDAKAFRLSRTAKNQKDFKVDALHRWKKGANYAILLAPLYQYPTNNSQIYQQAIQRQVTLFSFTHLGFLLTHRKNIDPTRLRRVWHEYDQLEATKAAQPYWSCVNALTATAAAQSGKTFLAYQEAAKSALRNLAKDQLHFFHDRKNRIAAMSRDELIKHVLKVERIENNITTISSFLDTV